MKKLIALACLLATPVLAQEVAPATEEDWDKLRAQAQTLREQAKRMHADAEQKFEAEKKACWEKFLVSDCQLDAKKARQVTDNEARRVDLDAFHIEQRIKVHDRVLKLEHRAEKEKETQAKAAERAEQIRLKDEKHRQRLEKKAAEEEERRQKAERERNAVR